jgi:hypothetical protein
MNTPASADQEDREPTLDDALTIDQMIARLQQLRAELPRGGTHSASRRTWSPW